jgi:hypothetical protein
MSAVTRKRKRASATRRRAQVGDIIADHLEVMLGYSTKQ